MKNIYEVLLVSVVITPLAVSTASNSDAVDLNFTISSLVDITVDDTLVNLTEDASTGLIVDNNLFEITVYFRCRLRRFLNRKNSRNRYNINTLILLMVDLVDD